MSAMQFCLEIGLVFLLAVTLVQAIRLERALGVLRRARAGLEPLVEEFDSSTRQAEAAIARLHEAAESAGRQVGRQTDTATSLKDDLAFLVERGDRLADRIDGLVRSARPLAGGPRLVDERALADLAEADHPITRPVGHPISRGLRPGRVASLGLAANESRALSGFTEFGHAEHGHAEFGRAGSPPSDPALPAPLTQRDGRRVRSQAERDLLKALRVAR